jgi:hypothetical protein
MWNTITFNNNIIAKATNAISIQSPANASTHVPTNALAIAKSQQPWAAKSQLCWAAG